MGVGGLTTGLASGIDYGKLLEGLVSLEKKPITAIAEKVKVNELKKEAYSELLNQALGVKLSMFDLATPSTFEKKTVKSSNEAILTGTGDKSASTGSTTLQVARLATSSVNVSNGVQNKSTSTIGSGTLSFELGGRRLDNSTELDSLNDGKGIQRGMITLKDSTGKSEVIDLASAVTVQDMLDLFNANGLGLVFSTDRDVTATTANGYTLKFTNGGANSVTLSDVGTSTTLKDLGFKTTASKTVASGASTSGLSQIYFVTEATKLNQINDGFGVLTNAADINDMRFYVQNTVTSSKKTVEVDLSGTKDVGDVLNAINAAMFNAQVNSSSKARLASDGVSIEFTGEVSGFQNINGSRAATDLGLDKIKYNSTTTTYRGEALLGEMGSSLIRNLNGGYGIENLATGTFQIQSRAGDIYSVNLKNAVSVSDISSIITSTASNGTANRNIVAQVNENGNGLTIVDNSTGNKTFRIDDVTGDVAKQLGFETTLSIESVLFNPIDATNDTTGKSRRGVAYLSKNSLPEGITENDMVGRSLEHTWSSTTVAGMTATESARIIAFDKAPTSTVVTPIDAAASSSLTLTTAASTVYAPANADTITDTTNLNANLNTSLNASFMVGATLSTYTATGLVSSTIVAYDSTNKTITLSDDALSAAGVTATDLEANGYTINYNHKVILEYDRNPSVLDNTGVITPGAITINDTKLLTGNVAIDASRIKGATISVYDSGTGTEYTAIVNSYTSTGVSGTLTLVAGSNGITGVPAATAALLANGYTVTYTPIQFANNGASNFLSTNTKNVDTVRIAGAGSNQNIVGKNLENRMMSGVTRLEDLNGGQGIGKGKMRISVGSTSAEIDLNQDKIQTVQDLIDEITSKLSNVAVEINNRGDGLRMYDTSTTQTSFSITNVSSTAASDLNLVTSDLNKQRVDVTTGANFYSYQGTVASANVIALSPYNTSIEVAAFAGLKKSDVIGSTVSYTDTANFGANRVVHAIVLDYNINASGTAQLIIGGQVTEGTYVDGTATAIHDASDGIPTNTWSDPTGKTINLTLKKHFSNFNYFGNISAAPGAITAGATAGAFEIELNATTISGYSKLSEEELVGSVINFNASFGSANAEKSRGATAIITGFNSALGTITVQAVNTSAADITNLLAAGTVSIGISNNKAPEKHLQAGSVSTTSSFLTNLASKGYKSLTATVSGNTTSTVLISDQFVNLNPKDVIGSLVTVATGFTGAGQVAVVTGYDAASKAVTIGGFYDPTTGLATGLVLASDDDVYVTYAKELSGAVIRSESSSFTQATAPISATLTNSKLLRIDNLVTSAGSEDQLIGSTITFSSTTTTTSLQNEKRNILDIIHDYGGTAGRTVVVLDEALPTNATAADSYTISFNQVSATIDQVDFASGVISTREKMSTIIGGRDFSIHAVVDGSYQKNINVLSTDTVSDLSERINGAKVGVKATVINDGSASNPYRLSITSNQTGDRGAVTVSSTVSGFDFNLATRGQDAKVIVGLDSGSSSVVSSSTNTVTEALAGITLNLHQASREKVTLTVNHDTEGIVDKTKVIVDDVNKLLKSASDLIALETEVEVTDDKGNKRKEKQKGLLFGDSNTRSMLNEIKSLLTRLVQGIPTGNINAWSDIGISLDTKGTSFKFDDAVIKSALSSKFEQVQALFTTNPNLAASSSINISSGFLLSNYNINNIRNGDTSSSGFSETGNGTNGIKLQAGSSSKYLTYTFGEVKNLYGMRLHHFVPDNLTGRLTIGSNSSSLSADSKTITDSTNLGTNAKIISDQIIGATLTVGGSQATITGYDASTGALTFDTAINVADNPTNGYIISTKVGKTLSFQYNAIVEYRDPTTNSYKVFQTYRNRGNGNMSVVFPNNLRSDSIRIRYDNNTGDSQDFTENGHVVRLMEMEVLDAQGIGAQFSRTFNNFTNANTGSLSLANKSLDAVNSSLQKQANRLTASLSNSQDRYIKQFQNLERTVSSLNSQSSFFQSQVNSLPKAFAFKNGG